MALVALVPLVVSHLILIGINRDSLETLEKQYLTDLLAKHGGNVKTAARAAG